MLEISFLTSSQLTFFLSILSVLAAPTQGKTAWNSSNGYYFGFVFFEFREELGQDRESFPYFLDRWGHLFCGKAWCLLIICLIPCLYECQWSLWSVTQILFKKKVSVSWVFLSRNIKNVPSLRYVLNLIERK